MGVRLGRVIEGTSYEVEFEAGKDNDGNAFIFVGWQPNPPYPAQSYPLRVKKAERGLHALQCPPASAYQLIEIRVDVPDPGGVGTLRVRGLAGAKKDKEVEVTTDEVYWLEVTGP